MRILTVDDERDLCEIIQLNLENEGYEVDVAYSAEEALGMDLSVYNLILLDVMMGEMSGFKLADIIRRNGDISSIPIIFITARTTENDTLTGFTLGADDYITKPFSIRELVARVKAVLGRTNRVNSDNVSFKTLSIDVENKELTLDGDLVKLTKTEYELILMLISNRDKVFSREQIMKKVWADDAYVSDRTVDVNVTRLRKKLGIYASHLKTRQGYGYGFRSEV